MLKTKWFQILTLSLILLGGLITIISFGMIMVGIDDLDTFDRVLMVGEIAARALQVGLFCCLLRAIALLKK